MSILFFLEKSVSLSNDKCARQLLVRESTIFLIWRCTAYIEYINVYTGKNKLQFDNFQQKLLKAQIIIPE